MGSKLYFPMEAGSWILDSGRWMLKIGTDSGYGAAILSRIAKAVCSVNRHGSKVIFAIRDIFPLPQGALKTNTLLPP